MYTKNKEWMQVESDVRRLLVGFPKVTITDAELATFFTNGESYEVFAKEVLQLEQSGILVMVKAAGRNPRYPSVAYRYKINRKKLREDYHKELQQYRFKFSMAIDLDDYFTRDEAVWLADLPYLELINRFILKEGFPEVRAAAPERSFELVGDEKWIVESGGESLLRRVGLWDAMKLFPVSDPLMFAVNPRLIGARQQLHLIIENKTTYDALLQVLTGSEFSTLIYGAGWKVTKSIENFKTQYPVDADHVLLYFGDIDRAGIEIWHVLNEREETFLALPFYDACLLKTRVYGKMNQRKNVEHIRDFLNCFSLDSAAELAALLEEGAYYPQEVLRTSELQELMCGYDWPTFVTDEISDKG